MADTKIGNLPTDVVTLADGDKFAIADASALTVDTFATALEIKQYLQAGGAPVVTRLGSDYTNSTTTGTEVTGLSFVGLVAGTYLAKWYLLVRADATTTSPLFGVNYTGTVTTMLAHMRFPSAGVNAVTGQISHVPNVTTGSVWGYSGTATESTTAPNLGPLTGVVSANTNALLHVEALVVVSDGGDLELWVSSEVGTSVVSVMTGSSGVLIRTA